MKTQEPTLDIDDGPGTTSGRTIIIAATATSHTGGRSGSTALHLYPDALTQKAPHNKRDHRDDQASEKRRQKAIHMEPANQVTDQPEEQRIDDEPEKPEAEQEYGQ